MVVLHLCGGPHVGVDHSADVALVAGADEPFHCCVACVDGNFAGLSRRILAHLSRARPCSRVDPCFCDVEVVEFCADSAICDGRLQCIEADGGDPGLHRFVGEHVWVRQRQSGWERQHLTRWEGYTPESERGFRLPRSVERVLAAKMSRFSVAEFEHARGSEVRSSLVYRYQLCCVGQFFEVRDAGPPESRFEISAGFAVQRWDRPTDSDDDSFTAAGAVAFDLVDDGSAGACRGGAG